MVQPDGRKALGQRVRKARLERGWSQTQLAEAVSEVVGRVSQSQISQFEAGQEGVLSLRKIAAVASALGLDVAPDVLPEARRLTLKLCPTLNCPSHLALAVDGRAVLRPALREAPADDRNFCPECGDILLDACPGCERPLGNGSHCTACGQAYLDPGEPARADAERWAAERAPAHAALETVARITRLGDRTPADATARRQPGGPARRGA